jgi:hypothetical protein
MMDAIAAHAAAAAAANKRPATTPASASHSSRAKRTRGSAAPPLPPATPKLTAPLVPRCGQQDKPGGCTYGLRCRFRHDDANPKTDTGGASTRACRSGLPAPLPAQAAVPRSSHTHRPAAHTPLISLVTIILSTIFITATLTLPRPNPNPGATHQRRDASSPMTGRLTTDFQTLGWITPNSRHGSICSTPTTTHSRSRQICLPYRHLCVHFPSRQSVRATRT